MSHDELSPTLIVRAWHEALNDGDHEAILRLSDERIEIAGPRGTAVGHDALRAWLSATRVELHPGRAFARDGTVVVEQRGVWRDPDTGAATGEAAVASLFRVRGARIAAYARFDDLPAALADAGLGPGDEV